MTDAFRVLVTGSRDWTDSKRLNRELARVRYEARGPIVVVHGACPTGADALAAGWIEEWGATGFGGSCEERHPAQDHPTEDFGPWPGAGPRRNAYMVSLGASLCLAFIGPCTSPRCRKPGPHPSHGASGCADLAQRAGIPVRRFLA